MSNIVFSSSTVTVPATEKIAVYNPGAGEVSVYQTVGSTNFPNSETLLGTVTSGQTVFGAFADGGTIRIDAGPAGARYEVGSDPSVKEVIDYVVQGDPTAETTAATLTVAELLTGIITGTQASGGNVNYTLPTGTLTDAGSEFAVNDSFEWVLINLSAAAADTVTVAAGTGHTIVGVAVVQSAHATTGGLYGNVGRFRTRKTAANTFVTYRVG